jgi:acetyl-CoA carboxylase biotin carboxyl carrier protein
MAIPRRRRPEPIDVVALTRELGGLLAEFNLTDIEVTRGDVRVRVRRGTAGVPDITASAPPAVPIRTASLAVDAATAGLVVIESPMVGTFYRASSPTAEPYVREGDTIKQGQIVCIIEAMKLMNEIEAKASGRIAKVLVENGQPVEYGQPLFLIDPGA